MDLPIQAIKMKPKLRLVVPANGGNTCHGCDANRTGDVFARTPSCAALNKNVAPCFYATGDGTAYFHYKHVGEVASTF